MSRPKLFIGSSVEGLTVAYAIQENLKFIAETTVWDQDVFNLSESSLDSLIKALDQSDFGIFIFSPDDYIKIRGKKDLAVRDNVIFELGLFIGKLTRKRSFIVLPDQPSFHLPTDLIGFTPATYETNRADKNMQAATGSASNKIREIILKLGALKRDEETPEITSLEENKIEKKRLGWVEQLFDKKDYKKTLELLKKKIRYTKDIDEKINLKGWFCYTTFQIDTTAGNEEYEKLISEYSVNNLSYVAYANNLIWSNLYKKAFEIIELGLINCERKITLTALKSTCLWETNQKNEAIKLLESTLESKKDVLLYSSIADYYIKSDDKKNAINIYHKAYHEYPKNKDIIFKFAQVAYDLEQYELSILLYKELVEIDKTNGSYWAYLGNSYLRLEFYNLSLKAYEKALELSTSNKGWIYANIGNLLSIKNLYNKAEENLKFALTQDGESEYAHNRLSSVYKAIQEETKKISESITKAKSQLNSNTIMP
ncbi:MAG: TIR domain-containing protein [Bacteroidota bacterium]